MEIKFKTSAIVPLKESAKEVVIVGRSNAGKSTLINLLANNKKLAKISSTPGKTLLLNYFTISDRYKYYLVDTPGYGYHARGKKVTSTLKNIMDNYFSENDKIIACLWVFDIRRDLQEDDFLLLNLLEIKNIPITILLSKSDKLSNNKIMNQVNNLSKKANLPKENFITYSSLNRNNIFKIVGKIRKLFPKA